MIDFILSNVETSDIERYYEQFPYELDYNIYQYGNLDIMYWELKERLREFGVTKTLKTNTDIKNTYMSLVRLATDKFILSTKTKLKYEV